MESKMYKAVLVGAPVPFERATKKSGGAVDWSLLRCEVSRVEVDFGNHEVTLHLPDFNCTDMTGAISVAVQLDPEAEAVMVPRAGKQYPPYIYVKREEGWRYYELEESAP